MYSLFFQASYIPSRALHTLKLYTYVATSGAEFFPSQRPTQHVCITGGVTGQEVMRCLYFLCAYGSKFRFFPQMTHTEFTQRVIPFRKQYSFCVYNVWYHQIWLPQRHRKFRPSLRVLGRALSS